MKKFVSIIVTVVAVLLVISAFTHINVRTSRVANRYWQGDGTIHETYEVRESRLLTGETIRTETFEAERIGELHEVLSAPAVDKGRISMYFY